MGSDDSIEPFGTPTSIIYLASGSKLQIYGGGEREPVGVEETDAAALDEIDAAGVEVTVAADDEDTDAAGLEETETPGVEEVDAAELEDTDAAADDELEAAGVEETDAAGVKETDVAGVEDTDAAAVDEAEVNGGADGVTVGAGQMHLNPRRVLLKHSLILLPSDSILLRQIRIVLLHRSRPPKTRRRRTHSWRTVVRCLTLTVFRIKHLENGPHAVYLVGFGEFVWAFAIADRTIARSTLVIIL